MFYFAEETENADIVNLMSQKEEEEFNKEKYPENLPILPIRNTVLYPGVVMPITIGRDKSIKLIRDANKGDKIIGVVAQKNAETEDPEEDELYKIGTVAYILKMLRMPDGNTTVIIQGRKKFEMLDVISKEPYLRAKTKVLLPQKWKKSKEQKALIESIRDMAEEIIELSPAIPSEAAFALKNIESPTFLLHFISSNLNIEIKAKQEILVEEDFDKNGEKIMKHLSKELQLLQLKSDIQNKARGDIDKQQREYFLQQQLRTIQEELGHDNPSLEIDELIKKSSKKKWGKEVQKVFDAEINKLYRLNPAQPEYGVSFNYLELILSLPWGELSKDKLDLKTAKKILDNDHFGLEKVKQRILEFLAVLKLKEDQKSPILCLYGPPGVGKTSLGKSIAKAMGREYIRMSLGGLHDEAELRGHRKTYIGAMPGRVIQSLKKVGTSNPVFVLDEIDKIGRDSRSDPSSALLEILDPEQNSEFHDNYIDLDYDLSKILFIATANRLDTIQPALRDRMEIINISGYTIEEKVQIAKKYLIPKQRKAHGLKSNQFKIPEAHIKHIVEFYTRESGVRSLEKKIGALCRRRAAEIVGLDDYKPTLSIENINQILGAGRIVREDYQDNSIAGVVPGLAWTAVGGEILFVESILSEGKGKIAITGQLGDVMKESANIAMSLLKARANLLDIPKERFNLYDLHIHFPEGAVPKDGPSAGVTIFTSLASLFTQRKVSPYMAMTGEITLRGKVLPVGGIKEKVLAAKRSGIKTVVLPKINEKDILEIEANYLEGLTINYVEDVSQLLELTLMKEKVKDPIGFLKIKSDNSEQNQSNED